MIIIISYAWLFSWLVLYYMSELTNCIYQTYNYVMVADWLNQWMNKWLDYCCSVANWTCLTLCNPMNCNIPGFPLLHCLLKFAQTHVHWVGDNIQLAHPPLPPSPPALNLSQHQGLFQWVGFYQVAKVLEFQLQEQSLQWILRVDLRLTSLTSLLSKGLLRVFSSTTVQKHQLFGAQPSLCSNSHIHIVITGKP